MVSFQFNCYELSVFSYQFSVSGRQRWFVMHGEVYASGYEAEFGCFFMEFDRFRGV
jgi:hypothetical protein